MKILRHIMRQKVALAALLFCMIVCVNGEALQVEAAGFSASASASTVEPNGTFTVSFGSGTTGQYSYSISGGTITSSSSWVEGSGSLTVQAGSSGTVKVTITAVTVSTSSYEDIDGATASVSVTIQAASTSSSSSSSSTTTTTTTTTTDTRSSDNKLKALSIEGVELSPTFSSSVTSYTAEVWDVEEITISATKNQNDATVSGTGTKTLDLGENVFSIVVTAENGSKKTYQITVTKNESPTVFFDYNGQTLGVVKNTFDVEAFPNFEACILEYDGEEIYGWYNTTVDMTILYLIDENDAEGFYVYKEGVITSSIQMVELNEKNYYVFDLSEEEQGRTGLVYEEITIGDVSIMGWGFESTAFADYKLIQLMDESGNLNDYLYSVVDGIFIIAPNFAFATEEEYAALVEELASQEATIEQQSTEIESMSATIEAQAGSIYGLKVLAVVLGVLAAALLAAVIVLIVKSKKSGAFVEEETENEEIGEDDFEDEDDLDDEDISASEEGEEGKIVDTEDELVEEVSGAYESQDADEFLSLDEVFGKDE